jgi:hypothetical protein
MKRERNHGRKAPRKALMTPSADEDLDPGGRRTVARRSFIKGLGIVGATLLPAGALLLTESKAQIVNGTANLPRAMRIC